MLPPLPTGDMKHWSGGHRDDDDSSTRYGDNNAKAIDIEITAYMLLAYTVDGAADALGRGLPLVYWLSKQRSPGGGFSSTQDTVLALQALARFSALAYTRDVHVNVLVTGPDAMRHVFTLNDDNKMMMQTIDVTMPDQYVMRVNGTGCAFVQVRCTCRSSVCEYVTSSRKL